MTPSRLISKAVEKALFTTQQQHLAGKPVNENVWIANKMDDKEQFVEV